ncbi:MAG: hypothetical protein KA440_14750 [Azonexus sp.]|jgi:hypothetical protein|nr:hypothetical protein [Azonexus sp.]
MNDQYEEGREVAGISVESGTVAVLNRSEIEQQVTTAHKFPRSIKRFRQEALQMVTLNESVAESCIYALPRGNKTIEGPSARFAEVVASAWGNCRAGARVVSDAGDFITAQGVFYDCERNVGLTYEVQRRITDSKGKRYNADMIGVTGNAASSIALRNAILKGVPKAFWDDMYQAARAVVMGDFSTLANRRADALKALVAFGVTQEQVFAKLGVEGSADITLDHLVVLRGLITAIKEGDTTPEQAFAPEDGAAKQTKPAETKPAAALPEMPADKFTTELAKWRKAVTEKKLTVAQIIATTLTKYVLTDDQKLAIEDLAVDYGV